MKTSEAIRLLSIWDKKGRYVYLKRDLAKLFNEPNENTFNQTLRRLTKNGILERVARNTYVFTLSAHRGGTTIEQIAADLRRGEYVYVSLESALSEWGRISQIPVDRITLMTTGRKGEYRTPYGTIEFTHTKRDPKEILDNIIERPGHPLPIAKEAFALQNLKDVRRNRDLVLEEDNQ